MKHINTPYKARVKGFTLIEFIVASALAIIVIMAAGSTYLMTRKLNASAQQRLDIQHNLRNISTQITRDARLAGSFGCYSTGRVGQNAQQPDFSRARLPELQLDTSQNNGFGVRTGQFNGLDALFFVYGQGEAAIDQITGLGNDAAGSTITQITLANEGRGQADTDAFRQTLASGGDLVMSSCTNAIAFHVPANSGNAFNPNLATKFKTQDSGELTLSKLHASAYVFNPAEKRLFRVDLNHDGTWGSPQLLGSGINQMNIGFAYTDNCPAGFSGASSASGPATEETFTFVNNLSATQMPSLVQIRLNYDLDLPKRNRAGAVVTPTTADYVINATVRSGNTCGTRMPLSS